MNVSFLIGKFRKRKPRCLNYSTFTTTRVQRATASANLLCFSIYLSLEFPKALRSQIKKNILPNFPRWLPSFFYLCGLVYLWTAPWLILKNIIACVHFNF